jgi:hypothetical protein
MARATLGLMLVGLLALAPPAAAVICTIDAVPAATLLLPYFEVDLNNPNGLTTLFSVNNASAVEVLVHVVVWSDLSVPVLDFNIYLTGYDVQSVNLRDIIINGNMPQTATDVQDPAKTISPVGQFSMESTILNEVSCNGVLPPPALPSSFTAHLQAALTGKPSAILAGNCAGQLIGDNIARGYITMDTVNNCTLRFPGDAGYFTAGGFGDATSQNVLWGDWLIVNSVQNFAEGGDMVHIEAAPGIGISGLIPADPATTTAGRYTFYGRYDNFTAVDNREPLASSFAARYLNGGPFSGGTSLLCWRDSKVNQGPFTCPATPGARPPWYPLGQDAVVIFDEQEHPVVPQSFPFSPQPPTGSLTPCPAETQRVQVNGPALPVPFSFGWLFMNMNTTVNQAPTVPPVDPSAAQAWIIYTLASNGHFAVGIDAVRLDSACASSHFNPSLLGPSSLRFKKDVADMGGASDALMQLPPATSLLEQVQNQHARIEEQSARIAAQQAQIEELTRRQAAVKALALQLEQLERTVEAQQDGAAGQPGERRQR